MSIQIRRVTEADDFDVIYNLINDTMQRFSGDLRGSDGRFGEGLKQQYCAPGSLCQGFIAEQDDRAVAFMGVDPSRITKNATLDCGFLEGYEDVLEELLSRCVPVVQERGGTKIFKFTWTKFGQVRNQQISLWEKLGFIPDEYARITTFLDLMNWKVPEQFDSAGIEPALELNYDDIKKLLIEDGEEAMAELFENQYVPSYHREQVILTLRDGVTKDIVGIAYYRVILANRASNNEFLDANAFGLHIRPQFRVDRDEVRRFVQGCLLSMKQLDVRHVLTYLTLKNFDIFAAMVTEGFGNEGWENANVLRLHKNV